MKQDIFVTKLKVNIIEYIKNYTALYTNCEVKIAEN